MILKQGGRIGDKMGIFRESHKNRRKSILYICLIVACMVLCADEGKCGSDEYTPESLKAGFSTKLLSGVVSQADAMVALELWTREMTKTSKLTMLTKPILYEDLQSIVQALKNRQIDFIALTVMDYLKIRDKVPLEPALVGLRRGVTYGDELALIVRREEGITDIGQLRGKRLVVHVDQMRDIAYIWLSTVLAGHHLPEPDRLFVSVREVKKASQAVLPVFFKQADVCLIGKNLFNTMVELNPQLGKELTVLVSSDKFLSGMFCFNKHLSADVKAQVMKTAQNMYATPSGKQILTLFQIDTIEAFKPEMIDTTIALLNKYNQHGRGSLAKRHRE